MRVLFGGMRTFMKVKRQQLTLLLVDIEKHCQRENIKNNMNLGKKHVKFPGGEHLTRGFAPPKVRIGTEGSTESASSRSASG